MKKIHWLLMLLIAVSPAAYAQNKLLTLDDIFSPDPAKRVRFGGTPTSRCKRRASRARAVRAGPRGLR